MILNGYIHGRLAPHSNSQDRLDPVFNKGQDVTYSNPFIELAPVLDATPQINSCMITT